MRARPASATPIARTEMVIAYSPKSQYAAALAKASESGARPWWRILETPGFRFGRTDPNTDPQGLNIIFMMQLAARYYHQPDLADKILGPQINPQQIFQEPQVMARLQAGQLDASSAYKTQPAALGLPFFSLPPEINLGSASMEKEYQQASVALNGKAHHPSPLVFYAAVIKDGPQPELAAVLSRGCKAPKRAKSFRSITTTTPVKPNRWLRITASNRFRSLR